MQRVGEVVALDVVLASQQRGDVLAGVALGEGELAGPGRHGGAGQPREHRLVPHPPAQVVGPGADVAAVTVERGAQLKKKLEEITPSRGERQRDRLGARGF